MAYYRFPWLHIGSAILDFVNLETGDKSSAQVEFTRALINDYELLKLSRPPREELNIDNLVEMAGKLDVSEISNDIETIEPQNLEDEVPCEFGKLSKKSKKKKKKTRSYEFDKFEDYWNVVGEYLTNLTWFEQYGDDMEENERKILENVIECSDPIYFIPEHCNLKENERFKNLTTKSDASTYEELFVKHCEMVKKLCSEDFGEYKRTLIPKRVQGFLKKIEHLGFTPGYTSESFPKPVSSVSSEGPSMNREGGQDKCVFDDLCYTLDTDYGKRQWNNYREPDESTSVEKYQSDETRTSNEVSFKFDPVKERHLIASNAQDYYKNDPEIRKYFHQRFRLFSKLNEGIIMDREGWFSVTPEGISEHIADRVVQNGITVVVDAFAGVGGNAIQFALKGAYVIAIDMDPVRLKCARHNAKVYGVENFISFICADYFNVAATWANEPERAPKVDAVFLSPPWGGPSYLNLKEFDLGDDCTPNGFDIFEATLKLSKNIAYFLPRSTKINQLIQLSEKTGGRCEIEQSELCKKIKTITAYYGDLCYNQALDH